MQCVILIESKYHEISVEKPRPDSKGANAKAAVKSLAGNLSTLQTELVGLQEKISDEASDDFAVVSEQIQLLIEQTATAKREIEEIVEHLRRALPEFPVYVVTTHKTDDELVKQAADVEDIVERRAFHKEPLTYLTRIKRAAMRFQESMQERLDELNSLTMKAASGELTADEQKQLNETRTALGLPFSASADLMISDLIAEARLLAARSENLIQKLKGGTEP